LRRPQTLRPASDAANVLAGAPVEAAAPTAEGLVHLEPDRAGIQRIRHANAIACAQFGEPLARLRGRRPDMLALPDGSDLARALERGLIGFGQLHVVQVPGADCALRLCVEPWSGVARGLLVSLTRLDDHTLATDDAARAAALTDAARDAEYRLRASHAVPRGMLLLVDRDSRIEYASRTFETVLGHPVASRLGQRLLADVFPQDRPRLERALKGALSAEAARGDGPLELHCRHADGSWRWLEVSFHALADPTGRLIAVYLRNLGERRRVLLELVRAQQRLSVLLEGSGAALWEFDAAAGEFIAGGDYYQLRGLAGAPDRAFDMLSSFHEADATDARAQWSAVLAGSAPLWDVESRVWCGDRGWRWLLHRGRVVERGRDGRAQRLSGICLDVDGHRRTQDALASTREQLDRALAGADLALWDYDLATGAVEWTDGRRLRVDGERESEGAAAARIHPEDALAYRRALLRGANGAPDALEAEYRVLFPDGSVRWRLDRGRVTERRSDGHALRANGVSFDIDARRRAEVALRQSEARYRAVAEMSSGYVFEAALRPDCEVEITWASAGFVNCYGCSPQEYSRRGWRSFLHPDQRAASVARYARIAGGADEAGETHIIDALGIERWLRIEVRTLRDPHTGAVSVIGMAQDITERRHEQQARQSTEALFRVALQHAPAGIALLDCTGRVLLANPALAAITGYPIAELTGRPLHALAAGDVLAEQLLRATESAGDPARSCEGELDGRNGERRWARISLVALPGDAEHHHARKLAYIEDLTERRSLEQEVLAAVTREQARVGSELHDGLGQELTGLSLLVTSLSSRLEHGRSLRPQQLTELTRILSRAIESTRRMARGLSPMGLESDGVAVGIRGLADHVEQLYGLAVTVRTEDAPALDPGGSTAHQLYRICQEALTNAAHHGRARRVTITLSAVGNCLQLSIHDDGLGFDPGAPARGMGLKLMRYRARLIGAELVIDSGPGAGTRVLCRVEPPASPPL
jgi:PAS domain S-box-containing protein